MNKKKAKMQEEIDNFLDALDRYVENKVNEKTDKNRPYWMGQSQEERKILEETLTVLIREKMKKGR